MNRRRVALTAVLAAVAVVLTGCSGGGNGNGFQFHHANQVPDTIPIAQRKPADQFSADLFTGGKYSLVSDAGKVVLLNFWAHWCGPCTVELPQIDDAYREFKPKGVDVLGIDTKDDEGQAKGWLRDHQVSFPIVADENAEIALKLGNLPVSGIPFSVLIDKHGRVAAVYQSRLTVKDISPVLDSLLAET